MRRANCLVTGGGGFLGQYVLHSLHAQGYNVTTLGRAPVSGWRTIVTDLTSSNLDLAGHSYSTVFHLAGLAHSSPRTQSEREMFFQVNVRGLSNLLNGLERTGSLPACTVLISSVAVYGIEEGFLLDETTPRKAVDAYGASKRQAEDALLEWSARHNTRAVIIRLPLVCGRRAPGNLGAMVRSLSQKKYLGIGAGSARRSMVLARDVAHVLPRAACAAGVFNLTDGYHPSFAELETAISAALGKSAPYRLPARVAKLGAYIGDGVYRMSGWDLPLNSKRFCKMTSTLTFSDEKARKVLGWSPSRVLENVVEFTT
jgi:nucleoside-diphosphate-sugar epimerase